MNRILLTGGNGLVGSSFCNIEEDFEIIKFKSSHVDLRCSEKTEELFNFYKPTHVIHLAARVGGLRANTKYIGDFYTDNIKINTNVLESSKKFNVKKVVSLLSTCVYPDKAPYPLSEVDIHSGEPHKSNFGYAYAKRMLDVQSRAYRQQYGCDFITAVPNNLYGENDNFDLENSHVIPAIIRKIWEAKLTQKKTVSFWGNGSPLREFTYAGDIKNILLFLLKNYSQSEPVNIGNTVEYSISFIVKMIAKILKYDGEILWDDKENGQLRKPSNNKKLIDLGWDEKTYTDIETGLTKTCSWFINNYPNIRL